MSHFTTLRTRITDAALLKSSLADLGITVRSATEVRGYNAAKVRCDIVALLEGDYDLGWNLQADGTYSLVADLWGIAKQDNQTELINSINQKYAVNRTLRDAKATSGLNNANVKLVTLS